MQPHQFTQHRVASLLLALALLVASSATAIAGKKLPRGGSAPAAPAGLTVGSTTASSAGVSWAASSGAAGYRVSVNGAVVTSTAQTSYVASGLTCGTTYSIGVSAYSGSGNTSSSATASATTSACSSSTPPPTPTSSPTTSPFVTRAGTQLMLDGKPWRFAGFNLFQANMATGISNCSSWATNATLDTQLTSMGAGHNVFRAWFFQKMATVNGQRDWTTFDHTLAVAKAHGYKIIATLVDQWNYCEGPYKAETWYSGGYKNSLLPGDTVPYRQWVQQVVARYRDDPTIALWELANEPEIQTSATNATCPADAESVMYSWAADVSGLIKSIDPNHLVSLGTGGNGNCGLKSADYATVYSLPTLDVCTYHDYWGATVALDADPSNGIKLRIDQCNALDKPIYAGEVGVKIQDTSSLAQRAGYLAAKANAQFAAGVAGFVAWNWWTASGTDFQIGPGDPAVAAVTVP